MRKENRNMYKVSFAETLLLILEKLNQIDEKLSSKIKNKTFISSNNKSI